MMSGYLAELFSLLRLNMSTFYPVLHFRHPHLHLLLPHSYTTSGYLAASFSLLQLNMSTILCILHF